MRTSSPLDRAADQFAEGAAETADLVADALTEVAHSAVDAVTEGGEALAALSGGPVARLLKRRKSLVAVLVLALIGVWLYRRHVDSDSDAGTDEADL